MPSSIYFFCEDIKFTPPAVRSTSSWIKKVAGAENKVLGHLNYIFCSDAFLSALNIQYLRHNTLTDVITFDTSDDPAIIEGEVYISIERVKENAMKYHVSFERELHRVMVHGILHLLGYRDKTAQERKIMRKKELAYLSLKPF